MTDPKMKIALWGVCGGIPTPLPVKFFDAALTSAAGNGKVPEQPIYYGGNTLCMSIELSNEMFIFDMGTGARLLGQSLHRRIAPERRWHAYVFLSHVHVDHLNGFPYFGPNYRANVDLEFYGPEGIREALAAILSSQAKDPRFTNLNAFEQHGAGMAFRELKPRNVLALPMTDEANAVIRSEPLNHHGVTLGYRLEVAGRCLAYTVDFEGENPPSQEHIGLASGADVWVTECQFTGRQYDGDPDNGLRSRKGEGHAKPEHVIAIAKEANPRRIITIHHDPDSGPEAIRGIAAEIQEATGIPTQPAREGDVIEL